MAAVYDKKGADASSAQESGEGTSETILDNGNLIGNFSLALHFPM
jgi:hypothetical protein